MSKFCNIDDWETVDTVSNGVGLETGLVADPITAIGFSIFMSGEAGTPAGKEPGAAEGIKVDGAKSESTGDGVFPVARNPLGKSAPRNVFDALDPPVPKPPTWVQAPQGQGWPD